MPADRSLQVERLYHAARQRSHGERAVFLEHACADDASLRHEVEALLAEAAGAESFLETPALETVAREFAENLDQPLTGRRIGSYQILSLLGTGGMGEVYRASDTKLGRDVALKVLPPTFAQDAERLARFQREARLSASLSHPNVAAIYGMEESDGLSCLIMELVPGQTLAEAGPLPLAEALTICRQIADGLEEAHRKNITHRDIKPANIKVTPEGIVKILDFGLAKALVWEQPGADLSGSSVESQVGSQDGKILGTPDYMSPEQVRGKRVGKQADIWAFGCVLYELLTGKHAFHGETLTDTISNVLTQEPDWQTLSRATPPNVRELLRRCLTKDARHRLQDIGDARIEIEEALAIAGTTGRSNAVRRRTILAGLGCVVAVVASLVTWTLKPQPSRAPLSVSRFTIALPAGQRLDGLDQPAVALSPDGRNLVYVASTGGTRRLYLRPIDRLEARPISGTEGAMNPFFSPSGDWLGFFAGGRLQKVSIIGGVAVSLGIGPNPGGANWSGQGTIAFSPDNISGLLRIADAGGAAQPLTRLDQGENSHRWPEFLPGGKLVLFAASATPRNWNNAEVAIQPVEAGSRHSLVQGGTQPHYAATGHLVYAQGGTLMAAPFDLRRASLTGAPVPVVEGMLQSVTSGAAQYSVSGTGSLAYVPGTSPAIQRQMVWVSRNGSEQPIRAPGRAYLFPRISPDGRRVAVAIEEQTTQIWIDDLARQTLTPLTFEGKVNNLPTWTPDGKRIAFQSNRNGSPNLYWQLADGSGGLERLTTSEYLNAPNSFSPDGRLLAFIDYRPTTGRDLWVLRLSDRKAEPFLRTQFDEGDIRFSPDGRWLAYVSDESGRYEVYVQPFPGPGGKWRISTEGGTEPAWNPSGQELFYREGNKMMAVQVTTQGAFSSGKPQMLFEGPYVPTPTLLANYDVSADGRQFLMLESSEPQEQAATQINVVLNWFEELKQRVPAK